MTSDLNLVTVTLLFGQVLWCIQSGNVYSATTGQYQILQVHVILPWVDPAKWWMRAELDTAIKLIQ